MNNRVRISAGMWRNRWLQFNAQPSLRPTPDRVRQTLFNWLGQDLTGRVCLDLFAGTGALGLEALSRGAATVTLVERAPDAYRALVQNCQKLNAHAAILVHDDALTFLAHNTKLFDLILIDPPYGQGWLVRLLPILPGHLKPFGMIYAEAEHVLASNETWQVTKQGRAGRVFYHLLECRHGNL